MKIHLLIKKQLLLIFILASLNVTLLFGQIVINEYSCSNLSSFPDNFGKYEDWIELYNAGDAPVNLAGYYLSDKKKKPTKWKIPVTDAAVIPAKGFFIVWTSKRDTVMKDSNSVAHFHTNFSLKQTKNPAEYIILSDKDGNAIETVSLTKTQLGHSVGRATDGGSGWGVFAKPSLKGTNNASQTYQYLKKPNFNVAPGFYESAVDVSISATLGLGDTIRYTLDGSTPTDTSKSYTGPISISKTRVLKAAVFSNTPNKLRGQVEYGTYFINENHTLEVISVSADSLTELLNNISEFVRPHGSMEYYRPDKTLASKSLGEFNKHGKDSWVCDQRSLDFIARDEMGDNHSIQEKIYAHSRRDEFQRLILRSSGDDNYPCGHQSANLGSAHVRDGYIQNLALRSKLHLDVRASKRTIVYVNGDYWGVYEIRENPDDHDYTKFHYKQGKYDLQYLLTWWSTKAKYGGQQALSDWDTLHDFILTNDMSVQQNYERVTAEYNVKSLVDYVLVNSFTVCTDWLNYNVGWWRGLNPKGDHKKWGFILWDNDATFGFYINYTNIPDTSANAKPCDPQTLTSKFVDRNGHIAILNKLLENDGFKQYYINRQVDLINTTFSCDSMLNYLDEYVAIIEPEMDRHAKRWYGTYEEWSNNVDTLRAFIKKRCNAVKTGMNECYELTGPYSLTLESNLGDKASVKMNSIKIKSFPWAGLVYEGINTDLKVKDMGKYTSFSKWTSNNHSFSPDDKEKNVNVQITQDDTITAYLVYTPPTNSIKIPEEFSLAIFPSVTNGSVSIRYNLLVDSKVNIELYDLTGRKVKDVFASKSGQPRGGYTVNYNLDSAGLTPGTYLIKLSGNRVQKVVKLIYIDD